MLPGYTESRRADVFEMSLINKIPALHSIKYTGKSTKSSQNFARTNTGFLRNNLILNTEVQNPHYNVLRHQLSQ